MFWSKMYLKPNKSNSYLKKNQKKLNFIAHINFNESLILNEDIFFLSFYALFDSSSGAGKEHVNN